MLEHFAVAFGAHAAYDVFKDCFRYVANARPDLEQAAQKAAASDDPIQIEKVFKEAVV